MTLSPQPSHSTRRIVASKVGKYVDDTKLTFYRPSAFGPLRRRGTSLFFRAASFGPLKQARWRGVTNYPRSPHLLRCRWRCQLRGHDLPFGRPCRSASARKETFKALMFVAAQWRSKSRHLSLLASRQLGHFTLIQSQRGPERYAFTHNFETTPSRPMRSAAASSLPPSVKLSE